MQFTVFDDMVTLYPAGWQPDPRYTAGNFPPLMVQISRRLWVELDRPTTIEEYQQRFAARPVLNTIDFRGFPNAQVPV